MRIVQVVQGLPPESLGGTETYAFWLSRELLRRGHDVRIFSRTADAGRRDYALEESALQGMAVTRVNNPFGVLEGFARTYSNPEIGARFGAFIATTSPDVVHFHHLMYLSTTCIEEAARRGVPVVMTLHDYWLVCPRGRFLKPDLALCAAPSADGCARCFAHLLDRKSRAVHQRLKGALGGRSRLKDLLRRLYGAYAASRYYRPSREALDEVERRAAHVRETCERVSLFLAPSRFLRDKFLDFGIPPEKIVHADCGLEDGEVPAVEREGRGGRPLIVGYIGVVDPVKGVHLLVEAFGAVRGAELRLYGAETDYAAYPDRARFGRQIRRSPHIRLMGRYENAQVGRILADVDVVVVPSVWYENAPLVIREAFRARRPVITADLGGMRELVRDGVDGLLFRPRDVLDLRRKIERCVSDPGLVQRLSANVPGVKTIAQDAAALEERYRGLRAKGS